MPQLLGKNFTRKLFRPLESLLVLSGWLFTWFGFLKARLWVLLAVLVPLILLAAPSSILPRVQACDPNSWTLSSQAFLVDILQLSTDKPTYQPGETVSILGTVRLVEQDTYYQAACDPPYEQGTPFTDNPNVVAVSLTSLLRNDVSSVSDSGNFIFNIALDSSTKAGTYPFTVSANCPTCAGIGQTQGASQDGSFEVSAYTPTLTVTPTTAYPGDTITVSGTGWAPTDPITLTYGQGGTATVSGPSFNQVITVPGVDEGPSTILASQGSPPYLTQTTHVDVKWHTLGITATITPGQVVQGTTATITGVVTTEDGKPQAVQVNVGITPSGSWAYEQNPVSDSSGKFTMTLDTKNATPQTYDIVLTASGKDYFFHDAAPVHLSLTVNPPPPPSTSPLSLAAAAAGTGLGLGAGAAASSGGDDASTKDLKGKKKRTTKFRAHSVAGIGASGVFVGGQAFGVAIQAWDDESNNWSLDNANTRKYAFIGAGWAVGACLKYGGTIAGGGWSEDFYTDSPCTVDDFGGVGNISGGANVCLIAYQYSFTKTYLRFGNGSAAYLPDGGGFYLAAGFNVGQCQAGVWI